MLSVPGMGGNQGYWVPWRCWVPRGCWVPHGQRVAEERHHRRQGFSLPLTPGLSHPRLRRLLAAAARRAAPVRGRSPSLPAQGQGDPLRDGHHGDGDSGPGADGGAGRGCRGGRAAVGGGCRQPPASYGPAATRRSAPTSAARCAPWTWTVTGSPTCCWWQPPCTWVPRTGRRGGCTSTEWGR